MACRHTIKERDVLFLKANFSEIPHKVRDGLWYIRRPLWNIVPLHYLHTHVIYPAAESVSEGGKGKVKQPCTNNTWENKMLLS